MDMKLFAAPMADISDRVFREISYEWGADHCVSEMVSARGIAEGNRKTLELARLGKNEDATFIQLFGNEAYVIEEAIRILDGETTAYGFDINMGCPVKKIVNSGSGSALLEDPKKIEKIVTSARKVTDRPLSVKIRSGFSEENWEYNCKVIQESGADIIVIHPRLREEFFSGSCNREISVKASKLFSSKIVHSGDIIDYKDIEFFSESGIFGLMVGRGAQHNPGIFTEIREQRTLTEDERKKLYLSHFQKITVSKKLSAHDLIMLKKQAMHYSKGMEGSRDFRRELFHPEIDEARSIKIIEDFFNMEIVN